MITKEEEQELMNLLGHNGLSGRRRRRRKRARISELLLKAKFTVLEAVKYFWPKEDS